jgi:hypothetical protein
VQPQRRLVQRLFIGVLRAMATILIATETAWVAKASLLVEQKGALPLREWGALLKLSTGDNVCVHPAGDGSPYFRR